jgi:hypothetical protein
MTTQQERVAALLRQCARDYQSSALARARAQASDKAARAGATEAGGAR